MSELPTEGRVEVQLECCRGHRERPSLNVVDGVQENEKPENSAKLRKDSIGLNTRTRGEVEAPTAP